ncbi:hypothetical protein BDV96DRAFT_591532 [Lophiotrema nucula]|uniref:Uncharacterized protein n=1 Tax=Lophiotrema nucula TaxID=690887 RepID=A0A6A5YHF1_9PLEO|nr:hypothetical protein BDV96DRAFT_591532 [Lophiotrema nucula]
MGDAKPTYHLPPNFSTAPPPKGPFHLGTVLKNFEQKEQMVPLNQGTDKRIKIDTEIYSDHKGTFTATRIQLKSGELGLWAKVMGIQGIGAEANISAARNATDTYSFDDLDTEYFHPTSNYISSCIALPDVDGYFRGGRYKKPVYLITGLKVAKGVTVKVERSHNIEGKISAGINTPDGSVQVGPKAGAKVENTPGYAFTESSDIVVGIQCLKLYHHKTRLFGRSVLESDYVTTGATFHGDDDKKPEKKLYNFIAVNPEDYNIAGLESYVEGDEIWMARDSDFQDS